MCVCVFVRTNQARSDGQYRDDDNDDDDDAYPQQLSCFIADQLHTDVVVVVVVLCFILHSDRRRAGANEVRPARIVLYLLVLQMTHTQTHPAQMI